jgi:hypothetical protein
MKVSKIAAAIALVGLASPALAYGDGPKAVGHVKATTEGVFIARNGKLLPATAGQTLYKGDRVVTRAQASAQVAMNGCEVSLAPTSILPMTDSCSSAKTLAASSTGLQGANGVGTGTVVVAVLATGALIGGGIALADGSNEPNSP